MAKQNSPMGRAPSISFHTDAQERFPEAKHEDVTGLCKLADLDEIRDQDYSLNPGRYVGVVIEEDGKTEEEFIRENQPFQPFEPLKRPCIDFPFIDRPMFEVVGNDGEIYLTASRQPDPLEAVSVKTEGGSVAAESLEVYKMKSIWKK